MAELKTSQLKAALQLKTSTNIGMKADAYKLDFLTYL